MQQHAATNSKFQNPSTCISYLKHMAMKTLQRKAIMHVYVYFDSAD